MTHNANISTSQEKLRKQVKSALHQEVSGQMIMEQLIKAVLNLQKEVKKLCKENMKLTELVDKGLQDTLNQRMTNRREKSMPYETTNASISVRRTLKFKKCQKKFSDGNHPPKLKMLIQSTKLKRTHFGN